MTSSEGALHHSTTQGQGMPNLVSQEATIDLLLEFNKKVPLAKQLMLSLCPVARRNGSRDQTRRGEERAAHGKWCSKGVIKAAPQTHRGGGTCEIWNGKISCEENLAPTLRRHCKTCSKTVAECEAQNVNGGCYFRWAFGWLPLFPGAFWMVAGSFLEATGCLLVIFFLGSD